VSDLDLWGVVNCGGFGGEIATPMETDIAVFDKVIRVNARGSLLVIKHTAPGMIARGKGGSIVNVSSQASLVALRGHVSYGASKGGIGQHHTCVSSGARPICDPGKWRQPTVVLNDMSAFYWGRPEIAAPFLSQMPARTMGDNRRRLWSHRIPAQ